MASTSPTDGPKFSDVTTALTPDLSYDFSRAFPSHGPSDLIVRTTDGEQFHVHKKVVCERSKFFDKAVNGPFKEANTGIVDMSNDPPAAVATLLHFLYTDKYEHKIYKDDNCPYTLECLFHLDGYITGVIYNLPLLQQHCGDSFKSTFLGLGPVAPDAIPKAITNLCQSTPDTESHLRKFLIEFSADNYVTLLKDPKFLEVMLHFDEFRTGVVNELAARAESMHEHILDVGRKFDDHYCLDWPFCGSVKARCTNQACGVQRWVRRGWEYNTVNKLYCNECRRLQPRDIIEPNFED